MSNLREEIAKLLAGYAWKWVEKNEEEYLKKADLILSLIDQHKEDLVKDDDQDLPENYDDTVFNSRNEKAAGLVGFAQGQDSMFEANFRKVRGE